MDTNNNPRLVFQFQIGSIKSMYKDACVRFTVPFQFQIGSIKRDAQADAVWGFTKFQFQIGSIKSSLSHKLSSTECSFNSKLVRLKDWIRYPIHDYQSWFQFQIGSIKSM